VRPAIGRAPGATGHEGLLVRRGVIGEMARVAALEVEGVVRVGRGGGPWRRWLAGVPVGAVIRDGRVAVRLVLVARPGLPLGPLAGRVRHAVAATVERLLGLELADVTVVVDGIAG